MLTLKKTAYLLLLSAILLSFGPINRSAHAERLTVFAAASLANVMEDLLADFTKQSGEKVRLSLASSSSLARQIEAGAEADIYFSANTRWMDYLEAQSLINKELSSRRISNRLVLVAPSTNDKRPPETFNIATIETLLGEDGLIAMGDPDHVPQGLYGKAALEELGWWQQLRHRIARTDNAQATLVMVERGETPLGITYMTDLSTSKNLQLVYAFNSDETPINYALAVTSISQNKSAEDLFRFLISDKGLALFQKYGFVVLEDTDAK